MIDRVTAVVADIDGTINIKGSKPILILNVLQLP